MVGRATVTIDYQAVMGSEFRPFDPNQGNYILEASLSGRSSAATEAAVIFHHVSRHLSDRPKTFAVAWNLLGGAFPPPRGRLAARRSMSRSRAAASCSARTSTTCGSAELNLLVRRPLNDHVGLFARGNGKLFAVDRPSFDRGRQAGGRIEAGIRLNGRGGVMEIFAGYEKRVDADPLDRLPQRWGVAGLRLLSR